MEIWKKVVGYNYEVSNEGNVRKQSSKKPKATFTNNCGYELVILYKNNEQKAVRVHRLVADLFVPNKNLFNNEVNHKDGNKKNNRAENLEWVDRLTNIRHAIRLGLKKPHRKKIVHG